MASAPQQSKRAVSEPGQPSFSPQISPRPAGRTRPQAAPTSPLASRRGACITPETSQRLACDASRVVMQHGVDGRIVEVSARTRTIPPALRRALHHRDRCCRFPGCGVRFGQGHHIRHWAQGGPTTLSNLVLLCRRHHRAVHKEGYQLARQPDGELEFRRPDGWVLPQVPRAPLVAVDPVGVLRAQHDAEGLVVRSTSCTR